MEILQFDGVHCKNCYKCVRHCPVKAIEVQNHRAQIRADECILCGECTIICPQKTKDAISDVPQLKEALLSGRQVIASVAPSFFAYFNVPFASFQAALAALKFADTCETAEGAYLVKSAYEKIIAENPEQVWISSCCSSVNLLVEKYYPQVLPFLAPVLTPIQAHARLLKEKHPNALVAFITPCVSKKEERYRAESQVDFVITFEETDHLLREAGIKIPEEGVDGQNRQYLSRKFPTDGGIIATLDKAAGYGYVSVSGYEGCVRAIGDIQTGKMSACFVEMSLCVGSCIGGPAFRKREASLISSLLQISKRSAKDYAQDFNIGCELSLARRFPAPPKVTHMPPSREQIAAVLRKMGKLSPADELNCGMCGYHSCQEKAAAVLAGKAEINMCLPFMHERAESVSNRIINITPNAIISVDMDLKVQQINQAACEIFRLAPEDILKQPVSRILDEFDFVDIFMHGTEKTEKMAYLPEYNAYLNQIFLFDKESSMLVCIMKDISSARQKKNLAMRKKVQAAAMADAIADKQLRIVQEIASLLGETAAETQIAVHELKDTIMMNDED